MKKIKVGGIVPLNIMIQFKHIVTKAVGVGVGVDRKAFRSE